MRKFFFRAITGALLFVLIMALTHPLASAAIAWRGWSEDLFEKAKAEHKIVILDLEAIWCHWCHVMDEKTYSRPEIAQLMSEHVIAVRVDQDSRPDLSKRYEDYGWPATIFFDSSGRELAKRAGFIEPDEFQTLLAKLIQNPAPEEKTVIAKPRLADSPYLSPKTKETLHRRYLDQYDTKGKGWGSTHKFLFGETEEYALKQAWAKDAASSKMVRETLDRALALIDPVWGGAYQYSVDGWREPHFEKIAQKQSDCLLLYSLAYASFKDPRYLKAAKSIHEFLRSFFKAPEGAFYTSMDADLIKGEHSDAYFKLGDAARRKKGIPAVDRNIYSRENGLYISGLNRLYAVTGDEAVLADSIGAANWIIAHRSIEGGGFKHGEAESPGPFLLDTLEMGAALISLYEVTGDRKWLGLAENAGDFLFKTFTLEADGKIIGYVSSRQPIAGALLPEPSRDDNTSVARFLNRVYQYSGKKAFREHGEMAMRMIAAPGVAEERPTAGVLMADQEFTESPAHITVVGSKRDPVAKALFLAAIRYPAPYKRVEWWDRDEGPLPQSDVTYPALKTAAAYACSGGRCSIPITKADELAERVTKVYR